MPEEPITLVPFAPASYINDNPWDRSEENVLWLLTPMELEVTSPGTIVTSIMGDSKIVGAQIIDTDTRFGYTAYGLFESQFKH